MGPCEVVRIAHPEVKGNPDGFVEINKSDFDPKKHKLYEPPKPKKDDDLTVDQLKAELTKLKVEFPATAKKEDLEKLLAEKQEADKAGNK